MDARRWQISAIGRTATFLSAEFDPLQPVKGLEKRTLNRGDSASAC
jgi:hypothetical protein